MTTVALTLADFQGKFSAISGYVTSDTLVLMNRSETLKELVRSYQASDYTKKAELDIQNKGVGVGNPC